MLKIIRKIEWYQVTIYSTKIKSKTDSFARKLMFFQLIAIIN